MSGLYGVLKQFRAGACVDRRHLPSGAAIGVRAIADVLGVAKSQAHAMLTDTRSLMPHWRVGRGAYATMPLSAQCYYNSLWVAHRLPESHAAQIKPLRRGPSIPGPTNCTSG